MGSHMNFKNFGAGDAPPSGDVGPGGLKPVGNGYTLDRQPSVYSLTFDEFQNTMGGLGKDFGSMNMDELLKSIWSAEETQILASSSVGGSGGSGAPDGNLQRQGSITLPRTLSQRTVDEVWRDLVKESDGAKDGSNGAGGSNVPQRQQTLGEMTLEEFLVRAGIVREDAQAQLAGRTTNTANALAFGFQQPNRNNGIFNDRAMEMNNSAFNQPSSLPLNIGGVRSSQQQVQHKSQQQQQQQPLFPKPATTVAFAPPMHLVSNAQLMNLGTRETNQTIVGMAEPAANAALVQGRGLPAGGVSMANRGTGGVTVAAVSPASHISSDVTANASLETPNSVSPVPYMFNRRGKCSAALEKVIERRQRRMIKNRESAARSRARKQAYTLELEAEVAKLKEVNEDLQRKQAEIIETQKNELLEKMNRQWGNKRQCLRRTLTGPW